MVSLAACAAVLCFTLCSTPVAGLAKPQPKVNLSSALRRHTDEELEEVNKTGPTARIYVLNLAERKDRCECMSRQLRSSPYPITRLLADSPFDEHSLDHCKKVPNHDIPKTNGTNAQFLFCTNYGMWQYHLNKTNEADEDFVIVLEDDAVIKKGFWEKLDKLFSADCQDWDHLTVDTFGRFSEGGSDGKAEVCGHDDFNQNVTAWGTHLQIIRKSAIPKLIESAHKHGWVPVDWHLTDFYQKSGVKIKRWQAGIVGQTSGAHGKISQVSVPWGCPQTVTKSNMRLKQDKYSLQC